MNNLPEPFSFKFGKSTFKACFSLDYQPARKEEVQEIITCVLAHRTPIGYFAGVAVRNPKDLPEITLEQFARIALRRAITSMVCELYSTTPVILANKKLRKNLPRIIRKAIHDIFSAARLEMRAIAALKLHASEDHQFDDLKIGVDFATPEGSKTVIEEIKREEPEKPTTDDLPF